MDKDSPFKDFINKYEDCGDGEEVPVLDKVMKNIFTSCNSENDINVPVSKLIEFISPFLQENTEALNELILCLDENKINPSIDFDTFRKCMTEWTQKIYCENVPKDADEQITDASKNEIIDDLASKNYAESTTISTSLYSNYDTPDVSISEKSQFEYQIQELQHQKRKIDEELTRVRLDLSSTSDLNESLQGNLDKLVKKLANEQKLNEQLLLEKKKDEELQEELSMAKKRIVKFEKSVSVYEKQTNQLQEQINTLSSLKQDLEAKIKNTDKKSEETSSNILILQSEIDEKKREIMLERDANITLLQQNEEFRNVIEQCTIDIEKVKLEKENVEKDLQELTDKNECLRCLNKTYNSINKSFHSTSESDDYEPTSLEMRINDSDNYYYSNFHTMFANGNHVTENLQDEICKATINEANSKDIENNSINQLKNMDTEKKLLRLRCDLTQHENCALIISKQKGEIETMSQNNEDYKKEIGSLEETIMDLKTQLSLSYDKETILQGRCGNLEDNLRARCAYLSEIQSKLNEYTELECKYNLLNKKIEELETDNSMKYVKIVNLTVEIEKLRQILAKANEHNTEELSKKIEELEEQRRYNENEKNELLHKIKVLNEEKMNLQIEKEKLLSKILELENQKQKLVNEKEDLYNEKENLQFENFACKSEQETLKMEMKKYQNEKESLEVEKGNLKSDNENLETEKSELEKRLKNRLEKLERKIDCMEMERRSLLTDIAMIKQDKDRLENDLAKIKSEDSLNSELSVALESLRKTHENLSVNYDIAKEIEIKQEERCEALIIDNTRMVEDLANLQIEYQRLNTKTKNLLGENQDLLGKINKNETISKKMDIENKQLSVDLVNLKLNLDKVKTNMFTYEKLNENLKFEKESLQKSIEDLRKLHENKDKEITLLKETIQDKHNNINTIENDIEAVKIDKGNLKLELQETREKLMKNVINHEIEKKNMKELINELEKKLEDGEKVVETYKDSEKQLRANCKDFSNNLRLEIEKHDYLCKKMVDLENNLFEEKSNCRKFKEDAEKLSGDVSKLKETLTKLESRNNFVEKQNEILDKEKNDLKSIWEECNKKLLTCIRIKSSLAQKNKKLCEENVLFSNKCNNLSEDLIKKTQMLDQANKNLSEIWNEMKHTEKKISDSEQERMGLFKKEVAKHKTENNKFKTEIERLRHERNHLTEKLKIAEKANEESKIEHEKLLMEKDTWLTEKIEIFKKDIATSFTNKSSSDGRITPRTNFDRLVVKNMKLDDKIIILEEKLVTEKFKNAEKIEQITKLRDENSKLMTDKQKIKNDLDNSNEDSQKKIVELYSKIDDFKEEIVELTKNNKELLRKEYENSQDGHFEVAMNDTSKNVKVIELQELLEREVKNSDRNSKYMSIIRDRLYERRLRLARATLHAMNVWKTNPNDDVDMNLSNERLQEQDLDHVSENSLDDEVLQMDYQINVTAVFLDQLTSIKNHELLSRTASLHVTEDHDRESIEQEISSNVRTKPLENLGLSRDFSRVQELSIIEMEEIYMDIIQAYTLDKTFLSQRCRKEKDYLKEKQESMKQEIAMLLHRLKELPIGVEISSSLEYIHQVSMQIFVSAKQYGKLKQQMNLCGIMMLIKKYVESLREKTEAISNQCLSINPSLTILYQKNNSHQEEKKDDDDDDDETVSDLILVEENKSRFFFWQSWSKEMQFVLTLSLSVIIAVIFFNVFENSEARIRFSPIPPPT